MTVATPLVDTAAVPRTPDFADLLGARAWARLHPDIRRRFGHSHATPVIYRGRMEVDRSWIGLGFALVARLFGRPLTALRGADFDAVVGVETDTGGGLAWTRVLRDGEGRVRACVRSVKRMDDDGTLLECVDGGLGMVLAVREEAGALVFESLRYFLALGRLRLPIPPLITPGRCRVAHVAVGSGLFRFELDMTHPIWGHTFSQNGLFLD
jgi:hypothetical protein